MTTAGATAPPGNEPLISIQVLRGVAAIAVVFYHVHLIGYLYTKANIFGVLSEPGKFGVNLFFVLSGFIICFAHHKDIGRADRLPRYVSRRLTRIYPTYWVFTLLYILAALAGIGEPNFTWDWPNILSTVTLVNFNRPTLLPLQVAWTLFYEMRFYLIFATFLVSRRLGFGAMIVWLIYIAASYFGGFEDPFNFSAVWNLNFLVGGAVFVLRNRVNPHVGVALVAGGIAGVILGTAYTDFALTPIEGLNETVTALLSFAFGAIILGCVALEGFFRKATPTILKFFGDASYSLYLTHSGVISVCYILLKKTHAVAFFPPAVLYFAVAVAAIAGGAAAYILVERPILAVVRRGMGKGSVRHPENHSVVPVQ